MTSPSSLLALERTKFLRTLSSSIGALLASTFGKYRYSTNDPAVGHDFAVYEWRGRTYCIQRSFPQAKP
jgi:hypothetical protein